MDPYERSWDPKPSEVAVSLEDAELWSRFEELTNEMIVTKSGRRMFPVIRCQVAGLEEAAFYEVLLEFRQVDNNRWKYINESGSQVVYLNCLTNYLHYRYTTESSTVYEMYWYSVPYVKLVKKG